MSRRSWVAVPLALLLALTVAAPARASGSGAWTDPFYDVGVYTPDIGPVRAEWGADGTLAFGVGLNQSRMYAGDRVFLFLDVNLDRSVDYRIELGCCSGGGTFVSMARWDGSVYMLDHPQTLVGGYRDGAALIAVHRSEVGTPQGQILFSVQTLNMSVPGVDHAPDGNFFYVLNEAAAVGGSAGPGAETPAPAPPPPAVPAPSTGSPSATPSFSRKDARFAVKEMVRRKLGSARAITHMRCTTSGRFRCSLRARKGTRRWRGTATVRVLSSGAYRASFTGVRTSTACRSCRRSTRW